MWLLIYAAECTYKLCQCKPQNGPALTFNPIVYAAYISTISQLDEGIKTLLYDVYYSGDVSPVLFNLGSTHYIRHVVWTIMHRRNTQSIVFVAN
jgi:hypothetical protein